MPSSRQINIKIDFLRKASKLVLTNKIRVDNLDFVAEYYSDNEKYSIIYGTFALVTFNINEIRVIYNATQLFDIYHPIYIPYLFCTSVLYEICSIKKFLVIHASCIVGAKGGILFSGSKGSGKSTLALGLALSRKYRYISDDKLIFNNNKGIVFAFPDVIRLSGDMRGHLLKERRTSDKKFRGKYTLNSLELPVEKILIASPRILFFPHIDEKVEKKFDSEKISSAQALERILEHRIVAFESDWEVFQEQILSLITSTSCFSLFMGTDVDYNLERLDAFVNQTLGD